MKGEAGGDAKHPLQRLRFNFGALKPRLRVGIAPVRAIPVAEINQKPSASARNAPMCYFVQRTGIIAVGENDAMIGRRVVGGQIEGFFVAFN